MATHPVQLQVEPFEQMERAHVIIRLSLLLAVATIGCSSLYWLLYLAVPALVALQLSSKGAERYLAEDAPAIVRVLRWLAAAYAYLWLLTDAFPINEEGGAVALEIESGGSPTTDSALLRLIYSVPALLVLAVLSIAAGLLWLMGALAILVRRRMPHAIGSFLALTLRYQFRLAAYHLSLVERYPSFEEAPLARAPNRRESSRRSTLPVGPMGSASTK
jgi:hypothetical protein